MKTKSKLWFGLCAIVLCFGAMAFGVYSVLSANLNLSGNLGFNMHNAIVEVSGTISPVAEKDSLGTSFTPTTKQIKRTAMGGEEQTVSNLDVGDLYFYNQEDMVFDLSFKNIGLSPINMTITIDLGSNSDKISIAEDMDYIPFTNNTYENFILADDTKQVKFALKLNGTSTALGKNSFSINISFAEVQGVELENVTDNIVYYQGIKYTLDSTTLISTVSGFDSTTIANFPDAKIQPFLTHDNNLYMVTEITYNAFFNCTSLASVTIPDTVSIIQDGGALFCAFGSCTNLSSVTIGNSVTNIGSYAFNNCTNLSSVTIPDSVTNIGSYAFNNCTNLSSVTIGNSVTNIGSYAFNECTGLTSVNIGNGVISIGESAFARCAGLTSVNVGNSVTSIGNNAFYGCSGLTQVNISSLEAWCNIDFAFLESNPLYYGKNLYLNGVKITDLVIPSSIKEIKRYAFYRCTSLTSVTIPDSVTIINYRAFAYCNGITKLIIGENVEEIYGAAFANCTGLTRVAIPDSVTYMGWWSNDMDGIEQYPFYGCTNLATLDIGSGLNLENDSDYDYMGMFEGLTGLKNVTIHNGVMSIGDRTFKDCTNLTSVSIPNSVMVIADRAFENCTSLSSITIPNGVMSIGNNAFEGCTGLTEATISNGVTSIGDYVFSGCTSLSSVTIGNNVTTIGSYAFENCTGLKNIIIPNSVNTIGSYTFAGCTNLSSVTIGSGVTSIGVHAFNTCSALTKVNILSVESWCNIVFADSISSPLYYGKNLYLNNVKITNLVIPNSISKLNNYAFYECRSITSVIIPSSVTTISYGAFAGCASLKTATFESTTPPGFGTAVFNGCSALTNIYVPTQEAVTAYQAVTNLADWNTLITKKA